MSFLDVGEDIYLDQAYLPPDKPFTTMYSQTTTSHYIFGVRPAAAACPVHLVFCQMIVNSNSQDRFEASLIN